VAAWLRQLVTRCTDVEIDGLVRALAGNDLRRLVRRAARFNWHHDVIRALGRQPAISTLLVRALLR